MTNNANGEQLRLEIKNCAARQGRIGEVEVWKVGPQVDSCRQRFSPALTSDQFAQKSHSRVPRKITLQMQLPNLAGLCAYSMPLHLEPHPTISMMDQDEARIYNRQGTTVSGTSSMRVFEL
jgi:hypothetical protein